MGQSRIAIDHDAITRHASRVDAIAESVGEATSAARGANGLNGMPFGVMCGFLAPPAAAVTGAVADAIGRSEQVLARTADTARAAATDFVTLEDAVQDAIRALGEALDGAAR